MGASGLHSRAIPAIINRHRGRAAVNHECYRPQTGQRPACHFTTRTSWDAGRGRAGRRADCVRVRLLSRTLFASFSSHSSTDARQQRAGLGKLLVAATAETATQEVAAVAAAVAKTKSDGSGDNALQLHTTDTQVRGGR